MSSSACSVKSAVRSAESDRISSCSFADRIARLSIDFYKAKCPEQLIEAYKQTVIATIVMQIPSNSDNLQFATTDTETTLQIISLGVGTKVLDSSIIMNERHRNSKHGDRLIRDCHAEVLARRGLLAFLYNQMELLSTGHTSSYFRFNSITNKLQLIEGITLHMYTSSQPCGNASIKKWAKCSTPPRYVELTSDQYPQETHKKIQIIHKHVGQVAVLVKRNNQSIVVANDDGSMHGDTTSSESTLATSVSNLNDTISPTTTIDTTKYECLPGTAPTNSKLGNVMTCSDKIAIWNALGIQGALLSTYFDPLYLTTITIGRKFSKIHAERALCCRLQDFCYPVTSMHTTVGSAIGKKGKKIRKLSNENSGHASEHSFAASSLVVLDSTIDVGVDTSFRSVHNNDNIVNLPAPLSVFTIHHPVMLSTSVKLDEGAIVTGPTFVTASSVVKNVDDMMTDSASTVSKDIKEQQQCVTTETVSQSATAMSTDITTVDSTTRIGAQFTEWRALCVWHEQQSQSSLVPSHSELTSTHSVDSCDRSGGDSNYLLEVIDGHTGLLYVDNVSHMGCDSNYVNDGIMSALSSYSLYNRYNQLQQRTGSDNVNVSGVDNSKTYKQVKQTAGCNIVEHDSNETSDISINRVCNEYTLAKRYLCSDDKYFSEWIVK